MLRIVITLLIDLSFHGHDNESVLLQNWTSDYYYYEAVAEAATGKAGFTSFHSCGGFCGNNQRITLYKEPVRAKKQ